MKELEEMPSIMTAKEVAQYLKLSPQWGHQTIQRLAREGKLRGRQIGDLWRFTRPQVEAYLRGHQ